jgi:hypothetical protein
MLHYIIVLAKTATVALVLTLRARPGYRNASQHLRLLSQAQPLNTLILMLWPNMISPSCRFLIPPGILAAVLPRLFVQIKNLLRHLTLFAALGV